MNRNILIALLIIIVIIFAGYALYANKQIQQTTMVVVSPTPSTVPVLTPTPTTVQTVTVPLTAENSSGETGTAVLAEQNGKVTVTITITGFIPGVSQPAHIHTGTCPGVGPIKYPLTSVVNGTSVTTLPVSMIDLMNQLPLAINIHKSTRAISIYTACGNILMSGMGATPSGTIVPSQMPSVSITTTPTPSPSRTTSGY